MSNKAGGVNSDSAINQLFNGGVGIVRSFGVTPGAGLTPAFTSGVLLTKDGPRGLNAAKFATIGPAGDGLVSDDDRTIIFYSQKNHTCYSNLTGIKTDIDDIKLGTIVAASGAITKFYPGQWLNATVISLGSIADTSSAASKKKTPFRGINGLPAYLYDIWGIATTTLVGTGNVRVSQIDTVADATATIADLPLVAATASLSAHTGNINAALVGTAIKPIYPDRDLLLAVTSGNTSGVLDVYACVGGYVGDLPLT